MTTQTVFTLINPQNGNLAFKIFSFDDASQFDHVQRFHYYSMIMITEGSAHLKADFSDYAVGKNNLLCFSPYQPFMLSESKSVKGLVINFHPDFFCIHKHHDEVACTGVLFNNIYQPPFVLFSEEDLHAFQSIVEQMKLEMQNPALAQYELLISYLKILLINGSRLKIAQHPEAIKKVEIGTEPFILKKPKGCD